MILAEESGKLLVRCDNCEKEWWITESSNTAKNKGDEHHCSRECRLANKKNGISPCAWCGTPVKQYLSAIKRGRTPFCSTECSKAHHAANNTTEVTCSVCGKPFTITNARLKNEQKTLCCSMSCSNKVRAISRRKEKERVICPVCGEGFASDSQNIGQECCSRTCAAINKTGKYAGDKSHMWRGGTTRDTVLRASKIYWKRIADSIREIRGNVCEVCGKPGTGRKLPVHHIIPWQTSHDDSPENLLVVCLRCHKTLDNVYAYQGIAPFKSSHPSVTGL